MGELRILDDKYGVADYICFCTDCNIKYTIKRAAVPELLSIGRCPHCYRLETFRLDYGPNIYVVDILKAPSIVRIRQAKTLLFYDQITSTIARIGAPMTVRQLFYQMSTRAYVPKSTQGYDRVQRATVQMRKTGILPHWVFTDHTRWRRKPSTKKGLSEALSFWQESYRREIWQNQEDYIEIWCEKDALTSIMSDVTYEFDVPLLVPKGYSSLSYLASCAEHLLQIDKPKYIYHFGDYDPSGVGAASNIEKTLRGFGLSVQFKRVAVTPEQIEEYNLPTRLTKSSDTRSKSWTGGESVELDAFTPNQLRELVRKVINSHLDIRQYEAELRIQDAEKETLKNMIDHLN